MSKSNLVRADVVVTRHKGAFQWLLDEATNFGVDISKAIVISDNASPSDVEGKVVVGNLPLHLACLTEQYFAIEFTNNPPRGADYTADDMCNSGARLVEYHVKRI